MSTRAKQIVACMKEIDKVIEKHKLTNSEFAMVFGGLIGEMKRPKHMTLRVIVDRVYDEAVRFESTVWGAE